jgi:RDD family.
MIVPTSDPIFDQDTILTCFMTIGVFAGFIALLSYFVVLQASRHRATYGMRLLSIQIVDESFGTITKKIALGRIILRGGLSLIPFLYNIISFFMILCSKKKQAPHDIMTETYIIRKPLTSDEPAQVSTTASS